MKEAVLEAPLIDFGVLPEAVDNLLQRGVAAYRTDRAKADGLFKEALELAPRELAAYYCLYKIHTYMGNLDYAADVARSGMDEAARQAGWSVDPSQWPLHDVSDIGPARFAMFTLKALSFIELKRNNRQTALRHLSTLQSLDPTGSVGWAVISDLAQGIERVESKA
jgi:hypothetical protein